MPSFRRSAPSRDRTSIAYISWVGRKVLYHQHHLGSPVLAPPLTNCVTSGKVMSSGPQFPSSVNGDNNCICQTGFFCCCCCFLKIKWVNPFSVAHGKYSIKGYLSIFLLLLYDLPSHCAKHVSAATAKSLQSCPTLCDPIDWSPPGSSVPGVLQARVLEWGAIAFSKARF